MCHAVVARINTEHLFFQITATKIPARCNGGIFFSSPPRSATHPPIQWVKDALTPGVKRSIHEADHLPPSEAKKTWSYTSNPPIRLLGVVPFTATAAANNNNNNYYYYYYYNNNNNRSTTHKIFYIGQFLQKK